MRIDRAGADGPLITGFAAGGFRVGEGIYPALLITPERAEVWTPPPLAALDASGLTPLLALQRAPEFILLGTGASLERPAPGLVVALETLGIGLEAMDSRAAARAWAVLRGEGRWIAGALYPL